MSIRAGHWLWVCLVVAIAVVYSAGCLEGGAGDGSRLQGAGDGSRLQVAGDESRLQVAVTLLPQEEIARAVGGERVSVSTVVPPGVEPHTYEPSASQIVQLSRSDIYFRLGPGLLPFEDALVDRVRTLNPDLVVVDTSKGITLIQESDQEHGTVRGADPHIWLAPSSLRIMAENMEEGFAMVDPVNAGAYAAGRDAYIRRTGDSDRVIRSLLGGMEGKSFLVFHPAWGYFAREYGLVQVAVVGGSSEPSARELASLIARARDSGTRVVFAEPQFDTRGSKVIAREIGGTVVLIDPLAPDTLENLERVASAISHSYGGQHGAEGS